MAIASRKFVFTMMDAEMFLINHVYQPIVATPAIRVDDALEGYLALNRGLQRLLGGIRDDLRETFPCRSRIPKMIVLPPAPRPFFPRTRRAPKEDSSPSTSPEKGD